ncbi:MAG: baseplate multidomain protein megatron, partial [Shimia sp.]
MATVVLSAAGAAVGGMVGGSVLGLSSQVIGRAVGAAVGRAIDQKVMGSGSRVVESGRIDRFRLNGASEGTAIPQIYGRMRVPGEVIWATEFLESSETAGGGGGKWSPPEPEVREYSYSISLAIALCEGVITRVGRIWADGEEIDRASVTFRTYHGTRDQAPDPKIAAVQGTDATPAFRGVAYVVFEDLELRQFGNRVPQFTFEVIRPPQATALDAVPAGMADAVQAVALMPGSGEYALNRETIFVDRGVGDTETANEHTPSAQSNLEVALDQLEEELPRCEATSLIVSWFGDDLRVGSCSITPRAEQAADDGAVEQWTVGGQDRSQLPIVPQQDGRPVYGGTPSDASVVGSIQALKAHGQAVTFYPFVLMTQMPGNTLPDPYTGQPGQPALPWRGRITMSAAPGQPGSPEGTAQAAAEVAAFFGDAALGDFAVDGTEVAFTGSGFGYRRFILHYAHLCKAAGGVEAFCVGSELRGITWIRDEAGFPAVEALRQLARDVRAILGPDTKISYAADWSEYFGFHPQDGSGDVYFHLDPFWADEAVDFIGIDNYMPLSDWRDGRDHADAAQARSIYDLDYLRANVEGGEGYDWFYASAADRAAQVRSPITDGAYGEDWIFRYKDLRNWWVHEHLERRGGVELTEPTAWVPQSKPFWFMEYGCAAIDKGTNQPNKFLDPKSSESAIPYF